MRRARSPGSDTTLFLMFEAGRIVRRALALALGDEMRLPMSGIEALRFVEERRAPTMRDLSGYLCVAAPSATSLVEGLVADGYLARREDAKDRRVVRLSVTKKGTAFLARITRARVKAHRALLKPLNAADRKELVRLLSKIVRS